MGSVIKHILIVNFSPENRRKISECLARNSEENYRTIETEDYKVALDICTNGEPDCLIVSLDRGKQKGKGFLEELARILPKNYPPVVLVAKQENEAEAYALLNGIAQDYILVNALDRLELIRSIENAILKKSLEKTIDEKKLEKTKISLLKDDINFLQTVIDAIPSPVFYKDRHGSYLGCNTAFENFLGLEKHLIIGRTVSEITPGELAQTYLKVDTDVIQAKHAKSIETKVLHADKSYRDVILSKAAYFLPDGDTVGIVGVMQDITDRKAIEKELKMHRSRLNEMVKKATDELSQTNLELSESQRRLSDIIDFLPDATFVIDNDGKIVAWNRAIEQMTGVKASEMLGKGNYEYSLPFYGERRSVLIDLACDFDPDITNNYHSFHSENETLYGETYAPALKRKGAYIWVAACALYDSSGNKVGAIETVRDITTQKEVESTVNEAYAELDQIFNTAAGGMGIIDSNFNILRVNNTLNKMIGTVGQEIVGAKCYETFTNSLCHTPDCPSLKIQTGIDKFEIETVIEKKDKTPIHCMVSATPIAKPSGKVYGIIEHFNDISYRIKIENELRESRQLYSTALNNTADMIFLVGIDGKVKFVNQTALIHYDLVDEVKLSELSLDLEFFWCGESIGKVEKAFHQSIASRKTVTVDCQCEDNFYELLLAPIIQEDNTTSIVCVARDITQRKKFAEDLQQSKEYAERLFSLVPSAIFTVDKDRKIMAWNNRISEITGFTSQEAIGNECSMFALEPCHTACGLYSEVPKPVLSRICTIRKKDGEIRTIAKNLDYLFDSSGEIIGGIESFEDITEHRRAERELERRSKELAESNEELRQFAYIASHDLQEPLRMVASYVQLLGKRYRGKLDDDADEFIDFAADGALRLQKLINDLLAYSHLTTRAKKFKKIDVTRIIEQTIRDLRNIIKESKATVTFDSMPEIMSDDTQLKQLFQNLISNAIKFKGDHPPKIHIGAKSDQGKWIFNVQDNGIGIEQKYWERIFVMFQRLHGRSEFPGTGIGLALCKKIAERHGGQIWVDSQPGIGSTFFFSLSGNEGRIT